jgi:hypothetical protein
LAAVVLFDAIPTGWVSNISQRPNIFVDFLSQRRLGGMETKLRETKLKLENSGEMRHTLVLWNQIISAIFRVQAWETKLK